MSSDEVDSNSSHRAKRCTYCKCDLGKVGRAREHIVPKWLQREWELAQQEVTPTHFDEQLNPIRERRHVFDKFLAGNVCKRCNSGWMSQLETDSQRLILDMAAGKRRIDSLNAAEATVISRWTLKTAYALHSSANWKRVVPDDHVFPFNETAPTLPPQVFVVGHTYKEGAGFGWQQSTGWEVIYEDKEPSLQDREIAASSAYKIGLRLGGLFLAVFHLPFENARPLLWRRRHVPLYPRVSQAVFWCDQDLAWPKNAAGRFLVFLHTIGMAFPSESAHSERDFKM